MTFNVGADAYDRFMGQYSSQLSAQLADLADIEAGQRVIDVGSGPGALTTELVHRLGANAVAAVDPSEQFVEAARERHPGVDVRLAPAEQLPFADNEFDAALAQLVVHFMADPVAGLAEMRRVTQRGGSVAASVWDVAGGRAPISPYWKAARELDANLTGESDRAGVREGHLAQLFEAAGLREIKQAELSATTEYQTFEQWWYPYTLGVGPAGAHAQSLKPEQFAEVLERCRLLLPDPPFAVTAYAWAVRGIA
jgi:SAM-dependent methyltransferase